MARKLNVMLLLQVTILYSMRQQSSGGTFTQQQQELFIKIHNTLRRVPNATDMNEVSWDNNLATKASDFAKGCNELFEYEDSVPEKTGITRYKLRSTKSDLLVPLLSWYSRGYFYNFTYDLCNITKTCQYYTHVMRRSTLKVGCGYNICPLRDQNLDKAKIGLQKHAFVVCLYSDSKYENRTKLYTEGNFCTGCDTKYQTCRRQLCINKSHSRPPPRKS